MIEQGFASSSRLDTIRSRLILSFILIVTLPMLIIGVVLGISNSQGGRLQSSVQLETVISYKENAIQDWLSVLKLDLGNILSGENVLNYVQDMMQTHPTSEEYQVAYANVLNRFKQSTTQTQQFDEVFLMDTAGLVKLSTTPSQEGQVFINETFFQRARIRPYVNPPAYSPSLGKLDIIIARPVLNENGDLLGVIAGRAKLGNLARIMNDRTGLGETGETYLVSRDFILLTNTRLASPGILIQSEGVEQALRGSQSTDVAAYENYHHEAVFGISRWLEEFQVALIAEQAQIETTRTTYAVMAVNVSVGLAALVVAIIASLLVTHSIATPVADLADRASRIALGNLDLTTEITRRDEIGALSVAFNSMTSQLRSLIGNLELRVAERTTEIEKRSRYLEASSEVSQATSSILNPDELIRQSVELIRDRFDLYYSGLFLVDESGQWAILKAGTGEAGKAMLNRGHRLAIGGTSMIGWSVANSKARIALEAGEDPVRLATAELPLTRSEAALPMRSRGQVLGAITVQAEQDNAFDEATIAVLQIMADQVAVAIDNARLFAVNQEALEAERRAFSELGRDAWYQRVKARRTMAFKSDVGGIAPTADAVSPEIQQAMTQGKTVMVEAEPTSTSKRSLAIPIKVRGNVIGVLDTYKTGEDEEWSPEEITLLESIIEQMGVALDSARLYEETQERAERERLIAEITARVRETLDVETVLKTAASEIFQAIELSDVTIKLGAPAATKQGDYMAPPAKNGDTPTP